MPDPFGQGSYLIPRTGGLIYFDCITNEQTTRESEVTEFPVESGANISDHYRTKLTGVKFDVFVSQEPINDKTHPEGAPFYGPIPLDFSGHPYPTKQLDLATIATAIVNPVGLATSVISAGLNDLINGDPRTVTAGPVLQFGSNFDALQGLLVQLEAIRASASLVDIATRSWYYDSFVITGIGTARDAKTGTGAKVTLEFRKVSTVSTQTVGAPAIPQKPKDTPPVNKGAQQGQDPGQMQSLASAGLDGLKKFFGGGP